MLKRSHFIMRRRRTSFSPLFLLVALLTLVICMQPPSARAHGDLSERIAELSVQIIDQPTNATLLLQRADLFRQHQQFDAALADLTMAAQFKTDERAVLLAQAHVFSDAGETTNALAIAERFLSLEPDYSGALVLRARCRLKLDQAQGAIEDFTRAIAAAKAPEPDLFLERARAQAAVGQFSKAANGLDDGMARLGETPALQLAAIEYDRQRAAFTEALARVDKINARQPVKEPWLVLRGEILAQAGRLAEAKAAFEQALAGIASYPPTRRSLDLTKQLQARAREGLARVETRLAQANRHVSTR